MSEPENFLERWSRRKREAAGEAVPVQERETDAPVPADPAPPERALETKEAPAPEPADFSDLPSLDSIDANTDVRGFLRPGVPGDMTRAALRRAWSSDPAIRDFVNLVENGHDFNDPDAIPGFGRIAGDEVSRLLGQAIGEIPFEPPTAERSSPSQDERHVAEERQVASASESEAAPAEAPADAPAAQTEQSGADEPDILQRNIDVASQDKSRDDA